MGTKNNEKLYKIIRKERKNIRKIGHRRKKLNKNTIDYQKRYDDYTKQMADSFTAIDDAKFAMANPAPVPSYYDTSKKYIISPEINLGSKNSAEANAVAYQDKRQQNPSETTDKNKYSSKGRNGSKGKKTTNTKPTAPHKQSKAMIVFYCVVAILALAWVIGLSIKINDCAQEYNSHSTACLIFSTTSE